MGYGDASCLNENSKIITKHIDSLAKNGIGFTDAHSSSALCTPSRYSLLTGKYNWRTEKQKGICGIFEKPMIKDSVLTIADLLRDNGYNTAHIGKWHLGMTWGFEADSDYFYARKSGREFEEANDELKQKWKKSFSKPIIDGPNEHGFEYTFGIDVPNWPPYVYIENHNVVQTPTKWMSHSYLDEVIANAGGPMSEDYIFDEILENITSRAEEYIEEKSNDEKPFFMYFASTTPHTPLTPHKDFVGKSGLNSAYADLVLETDASLGRLISKLKECGIEEDTLIIFASDNGCAPYVGIDKLENQGHFPSYVFRGFKADAWDGGHRIPFLMQWKNGFKNPKTIDNVVCLTDVFSTIANVANCEYEENIAQDSFNLLPLIESNTSEYEREYCIHHSGSGRFAIRNKKWKLILCPLSGGYWVADWKETILNEKMAKDVNLPPFQLYDMENDKEEKVNLIEKHPKIAKELLLVLIKSVEDGRTTKGNKLQNATEVDIFKTSEYYIDEVEKFFSA